MTEAKIITGVAARIGLSLHTEANAAPEWVHILPAGNFTGADGRGPYHVENAPELFSVSLPKKGAAIPVDYNHGTYLSRTRAAEAKAAGWITELQSRDDGVWGRVEWTSAGEKAVADKEYRYLSPAFATGKNGVVTRIDHIALTNTPNLGQLSSLHTRASTDSVDALFAGIREDMNAIQLMSVIPMRRTDDPPANAERDAMNAEIRHRLGMN